MGVPVPDRIRFRPVEGKDGPSYELTVPIAFDRLLVSVIPSLQVRVASPRGSATLPAARRSTPRPGRMTRRINFGGWQLVVKVGTQGVD